MCICWTTELSLSSKVWKTVLCKEQKGHQETISFFQFCFFCNFDYRCHFFFFWWKLLKEKLETRFLSWGDAQRKSGENKRQNAQSPRHPVRHATQICPLLCQPSGPFTDTSCLEIRESTMGSINAGIPFIPYLCILSISLTAKHLGVNCEIKFVGMLKC